MLGSSPRPWGTLEVALHEATPGVGSSPRPWGTPAASSRRCGSSSVHPHARGEHSVLLPNTALHTGSSPRPWGTRHLAELHRLRQRFIPTPVGNTPAARGSLRSAAVHPHARGEHCSASGPSSWSAGSSPRPWGTLRVRQRRPHPERFIPTPVGNTDCTVNAGVAAAVHPHARGEHTQARPAPSAVDGSSPRPWGTRSLLADDLGIPRFIPTPVGNTTQTASLVYRHTVHPHARGEHEAKGYTVRCMDGSSPRPWGTPTRTNQGSDRWRFIPTPVGNTFSVHAAISVATVHPHARGEHRDVERPAAGRHGSSPRPWGTLQRCLAEFRELRFIPTPVGNTPVRAPPYASGPVHPHARGEHCSLAASSPPISGSSPRPWGTLADLHPGGLHRRFIPTPVGNTIDWRTISAPMSVHPHARGEHPGCAWPDSQRIRFIPTPVGNTPRWPATPRPHTVHPHARGEHDAPGACQCCNRGSSPRPWGTPGSPHPSQCQDRFIPTPVGNTRRCPPAGPRTAVHPHARGEHAGPRRRQDAGRRFIPTPVGNTRGQSSTTRPTTVHPHARGEHDTFVARPGSMDGSSPRPWGTQIQRHHASDKARFIPTPVGNTRWLLM